MKSPSRPQNAWISYGLLLAIFAWFMAQFFHSLSIDPPGSYMESSGAVGYGRNGKGADIWGGFIAVEFLILLAILAPHKGHRHWAIVLTGFIIAALWTSMLCLAIMHSSPVFGIHLKWMIMVSAILLFALILGFFDRHYHLPSRGSFRLQFFRGLVVIFSALLAGVLTIIILVGGFVLIEMLL